MALKSYRITQNILAEFYHSTFRADAKMAKFISLLPVQLDASFVN